MQQLVDVQGPADRNAGPIHDLPLGTALSLLLLRGDLEDSCALDGVLKIRTPDDVRSIGSAALNDVDVILRRILFSGSRSVDEQTFADLDAISRFEHAFSDLCSIDDGAVAAAQIL